MDYTITKNEITRLSLLCLGGGGCAVGFGIAVPAGHPAAAIVTLIGAAGFLLAYAALTYRVMVLRDPDREETGSR